MRNRLDQWLSLQPRGARQKFCAAIGIKTATGLYRYCLPLDHPNFRVPRPDIVCAIYRATGGEVRPDHFYALPNLQLDLVEAVAASERAAA